MQLLLLLIREENAAEHWIRGDSEETAGSEERMQRFYGSAKRSLLINKAVLIKLCQQFSATRQSNKELICKELCRLCTRRESRLLLYFYTYFTRQREEREEEREKGREDYHADPLIFLHGAACIFLPARNRPGVRISNYIPSKVVFYRIQLNAAHA